MQINRLLELVYILLHRKNVPAKELAEQLGVSRRTIYRDIDALSLAGIPVYTEKGKGGGVRLLPDSVLNKSILSEQEQNEILTALHGLSNMKISEANQVLKRLSTIFNKTAADWLKVDFSDWSGVNDYFDDFKTAILERRVAQFDYYNSYGDKTFRRVEPVQLWFKSKSWYLKGFCLAKQDMRVYKLARVKNLVVTGEKFLERNFVQDNFESTGELSDIQTTDTNQNNEAEQYEAIKLRVFQEMKYRLFDDFGEEDIEEQPDGSFILTMPLPQDNWLYGFVLSFGEYAEVLEPEHFRETIKMKVKKISARYL